MSDFFTTFYRGRRVLVTGHTGFKGSWLTLWLNQLGAKVTGLSVDIPTQPSLFEVAGVADACDHNFGDINDYDTFARFIDDGAFDIVFHLAAQPLVRLSYVEPLRTLITNVIGSANVFEAVRGAGRPCSIVAVTSDKCYENSGQVWGFRENDPMGGSDPYSMSKGAAELVAASWRRSYFSDGSIRLASARAGNVIGGGDWAADRIVTDSISALRKGTSINIRNPCATRPWQHVLEPLSGYLMLGAMLNHDIAFGVDEAWNFGPVAQDVRPVRDLVNCIIHHWGSGSWKNTGDAAQPEEAMMLSLNCDKANQRLGWVPLWRFDHAIGETVSWFKAFDANADMRELTCAQISSYAEEGASQGVSWATGDIAKFKCTS